MGFTEVLISGAIDSKSPLLEMSLLLLARPLLKQFVLCFVCDKIIFGCPFRSA